MVLLVLFQVLQETDAKTGFIGENGKAEIAVKSGFRFNPNGGEGRTKAWIGKVLDCSAVTRKLWQS